MSNEPVLTPSVDSSEGILVDWLELVAFFNEFGIARLDALVSSLDQQEEEDADFGTKDKREDELREKIGNEIAFREADCEGAYPFEHSEDGEELRLKDNWRDEQYAFYLTCLLTSHLTASQILEKTVHPDLISRLRNRVFQVVSVFAMAGLAQGPAASVGWPRESKEAIIAVLKRAEERGAGIRPRTEAGEYTRPREKDGGIDVMSWTNDNRLPPALLYYAQVASGANWHGKPVITFVETFEDNYLDLKPRGNRGYATLIPYRETDFVQWFHEHSVHKLLLDRTRIPKHGWAGVVLSRSGIHMDEAANLPQVTTWVENMRESLLA
ncbi:hypothetical protein N7379_20070 [Rhizobium pusense]|uniref:hypothetical protein n=1 Tax=Agrobacterium pusense TaxID=648995 RepID=UPI002449F2B0|nr:hypothetical protein [Agrobacterium pusense]MDH0116791.1 hypothetical protein [Agrobacterium pusense]